MRSITEIILWLIVAAALVLIIMNPSGFSQDVTATSGAGNSTLKILTGSGYQKAA